MNFPEEVLNCNEYVLELELNNLKKRSGIYIKKNIKYQRRNDLEKENCHVVIIDIVAADILRLICVYRSFRPQDLMSPIILFEKQLGIMYLSYSYS